MCQKQYTDDDYFDAHAFHLPAATFAGSLAQHHAENLSGIILAESVKSGAKVIYGGSPSLQAKTPLMSHPQILKFILAYNQIGKYFKIPTHA